MEHKTIYNIRKGFVAAIPIVLGYFPIAVAFGLLAKDVGISIKDSSLFSLMVYAGASQFMALDLIKAGMSTGSIILATFLLNLRHMMMSASLSVNLNKVKKQWLPLVAFGITDETFSVSSFTEEDISLPFILTLNFASYTSWVAGTVVGYLVGEILPKAIQSSLSIGLYAMFTALLVPEMKKSTETMFLSIIAAITYILISHFNILSSGWDIIFAVVISSFVGVILFYKKTREGYE